MPSTTTLGHGLQSTPNEGFTSKSTGHTYETSANGQANFIEALKLCKLNTSLVSVSFYTVDSGWVAHTRTQFQQAFVDGGTWKQAQYTQYTGLENQVNEVTTMSAVETVV